MTPLQRLQEEIERIKSECPEGLTLFAAKPATAPLLAALGKAILSGDDPIQMYAADALRIELCLFHDFFVFDRKRTVRLADIHQVERVCK